jgi:hypothetical protein
MRNLTRTLAGTAAVTAFCGLGLSVYAAQASAGNFPDAPNRNNFTSARVDPGKPCRHAVITRVSVGR